MKRFAGEKVKEILMDFNANRYEQSSKQHNH
jgi:hypothetical protein